MFRDLCCYRQTFKCRFSECYAFCCFKTFSFCCVLTRDVMRSAVSAVVHCPFVCLSHSCIVSKRQKISRLFLNPSDISKFHGNPLAGALNTRWLEKFGHWPKFANFSKPCGGRQTSLVGWLFAFRVECGWLSRRPSRSVTCVRTTKVGTSVRWWCLMNALANKPPTTAVGSTLPSTVRYLSLPSYRPVDRSVASFFILAESVVDLRAR